MWGKNVNIVNYCLVLFKFSILKVKICDIQWILVISTLFISNNHLSQSLNKVPVLTWKSTISNKILSKRGEIAPEEQFLLFSTIFQYISNFSSQITYSAVKCGCSIYFILNSADLICQGTSGSISESPLDFEIMSVDCIHFSNYAGLLKLLEDS